jgi:hypothetical protein
MEYTVYREGEYYDTIAGWDYMYEEAHALAVGGYRGDYDVTVYDPTGKLVLHIDGRKGEVSNG